MSCAMCHQYFFFLQIGGASRWRVCYQRGLPHLVSKIIPNFTDFLINPSLAVNEPLNQSFIHNGAQCCPVKCYSVQCSAVQCSMYSTVQCSVLDCSAVKCIAVQCTAVYWDSWGECNGDSIVRRSSVLGGRTRQGGSTALHASALHCTTVHCTVKLWNALHNFALHCITIRCTGLHLVGFDSKWNVILNAISLKMECHSKWTVFQNGMSLKMECRS